MTEKRFELRPGQVWNAEMRVGEKVLESLQATVTEVLPGGEIGIILNSGHKYRFPQQVLEETGRCGIFCLTERTPSTPGYLIEAGNFGIIEGQFGR